MKTQNLTMKQRGFFDLGISLLILAIGGGTVATTNMLHESDTQTASSEVVIESQANDLRAWDIDS